VIRDLDERTAIVGRRSSLRSLSLLVRTAHADGLVFPRRFELAQKAPTGGNAQNWGFVVVRDPAVKAKLARLNRGAWSLYGGIGRRLHRDNPPMRRIIHAVHGSIYPSVQNLLPAARAAGLGAALITLPLWSTLLARRARGLPRSVKPGAIIPLGWPRGRYGPTTHRPVGEVVHLDRYGRRPFLPPVRANG
jgi:nitroreductase